MEDKVGRLLDEVERLVMHLKHQVPPEAVGVDEIIRLVDEIRVERKEPRNERTKN
jgi:hypothetical protein